LAYLRTFAEHPHRGTEHPEILPGLRTATSKKFVVYFEIDETRSEVRILAVFFGGVDHIRQILERLRP
jgi:toxin ParE1/3/4